MHWKHFILIAIGWAALGSRAGLAQACCSGGTPLSGSLGLQHFEVGSGLLELSYDYNTQHDLVSGSEELEDNPRRRNTHSALLRGGFAFHKRWTFIGLLSLVRQEEVTTRLNGGKSRLTAQGIGDAVAFFQFNAFTNLNHSLLLGAGAEAPIGHTGRTNPETGLPLHPDLQPGRGAWALLGGARYTFFHTFRPTMSFTANVTYRLTTPASRYEGLQEYEFGDELRVLTGLADRFFIGNTYIDPSLLMLYRFTAPDKANGLESPNTGGHWVHIRPGMEYGFSPSLQLGAFVELPLYRNLTDTQLTTTARVRISLRYIFQPAAKMDFEPRPF